MLKGQFFPIFIATVVGIVTIPLTYSVLKPSSDPGATAPRIKTDYRPDHADLIDIQRKAQKKKERKLKRIVTVIAGWAIMAFMAYLIYVTARTIPKIWNPYDILCISDVRSSSKSGKRKLTRNSLPPKKRSNLTINDFLSNSIQTRSDQTLRRTRPSNP